MPICPTRDNILEFRVSPENSGQRLDLFLARQLADSGISRGRIKQLILDGQAGVDGRPVSLPRHELFSGQTISLILPAAKESDLEPQKGNLSIAYQEKGFLVLNKPPGLTVHPCPSCPTDTLVNILLHHFPDLGKISGLRPGIVHRLDKDTSGLLVVALDEATRLKLSEAFSDRTVAKEYLAIVKGVPRQSSGIINEPIGRHPTHKTRMSVCPGGKEAISEYRVLASGEDFSLPAVKIYTGRTHQIRVHLTHLGHPLWGDSLYGGPKYRAGTQQNKQKGIKIASRQMLHAWKLEFAHPDSKKLLSFNCPLPDDFIAALSTLIYSPLRVVITGLPGCGKSGLLYELGRQGLPIWSADEEVAKLYRHGEDAWQLIKGRFGGRFIDSSDNTDKSELFKAMHTEPGLHREVEELIHPIVKHRLDNFWKQQTKPEVPAILVAEVPLFLEVGFSKGKFNWANEWNNILEDSKNQNVGFNRNSQPEDIILVYVDTSTKQRYSRMEKKGISQSQAAILDSWQWGEEKKKSACDLIINNNQGVSELQIAAKDLVGILSQLAQARQQRSIEMLLESVSKE